MPWLWAGGRNIGNQPRARAPGESLRAECRRAYWQGGGLLSGEGARSGEGRGGEEGRSRGGPGYLKKKKRRVEGGCTIKRKKLVDGDAIYNVHGRTTWVGGIVVRGCVNATFAVVSMTSSSVLCVALL